MVGDSNSALASAQMVLSSLDFAHKAEVEDKLSELSGDAYATFADAVARSVSDALRESDFTWESAATANWEEFAINDAEGNSISFRLPCMPSPLVMDQLFAAVSAGHKARVFGKTNVSNAKLFKSKVLGAFLDHGKGGLALTEKGVLQCLFDQDFLRQVLSLGEGEAMAAGAMSTHLPDQLDPIDWATYEPYLRKNVVKAVAGCSLLFGIEGHDWKQEKGKSFVSQSNILPTSENVPRFNLLPISSPSSFLDLDLDMDAAAKKAEEQRKAGGSDGQGGAKSGSSSVFGSILGEKAAEASAMAQDLFSGAGFFTSLTSNK